MLDMVRKHTVEGSGNHRTICTMLDRTRESLRQTKDTTRSFVPPTGMKDVVPIGSSSASMYPGYSPADVLYGDPAREFGEQWTLAKEQGAEFNTEPDGPQYELGQAKGVRKHKKSIEQVREELAAKGEPLASIPKPGTPGTQTQPGPETQREAPSSSASSHIGKDRSAPRPTGPSTNQETPLCIVDTKPTPVDLPLIAPSKKAKMTKRDGSMAREQSKKKRKHQEDTIQEGEGPLLDEENNPPKQKEPKVKKDETSSVGQTTANGNLEQKKSKKRKEHADDPLDTPTKEPKKRDGASSVGQTSTNGNLEQKKSKKRKERADKVLEPPQDGETEKRKSKRHKDGMNSSVEMAKDKKPNKEKSKKRQHCENTLTETENSVLKDGPGDAVEKAKEKKKKQSKEVNGEA